MRVDKKISTIELEKHGLVVDNEEIIPPNSLREKTQANLRHERRIPYFKFCGRVYYNQSDLVTWAQKQKVNIAS